MSKSKEDRTVLMENVQIIFRNFSGKEDMYNREGDRNFCVILPDTLAEQMERDGWNVKTLSARDEDEEDRFYLQVKVNFKGRPPRVVMISSSGRTPLHEDEVEVLDWVDIETVDLIVRPYEWVVSGKTGISAYLQSLFITIIEDPLELKYAQVNDRGDIE